MSLFTDVASEMLYPIMPVYLKSIGFSVILIGVLEGIAEATAGLSKGYFGQLSDNSGKRVPFVRLGYTLSAFSKPLLAVYANPLWIFFSRTLDRLGKGIRTGARDAILSDQSTKENKATIFGFHRAFDTLGAVMGPTLALIYLYFNPGNYKALFLIAFAPGLMAVLISFLLKEKKAEVKASSFVSFFSSISYWKHSSVSYKKVVGALLFFALFNSSDMFLLLKAKQAGLSDFSVIEAYIFYNLVYAIFSFPIGILADKIGLKSMVISGLVFFAAAYFGMAATNNLYFVFGMFFLYGLYAAASDGISKAWISNISDKKDTATAIGSFAGFQSIGALFASSITGFIWFKFGGGTALFLPAAMAILTALYFLIFVKSER